MGKITVRRPQETTVRVGRESFDAAQLARLGEGMAAATNRAIFPCDGEPLQLFEVVMAPDSEFLPHAHDQAEIIAIVEGELRLGAKVCGVGSAVFIDKLTLYSLRAGPAGCRYLNFRPAPGAAYLTKEEFLARR